MRPLFRAAALFAVCLASTSAVAEVPRDEGPPDEISVPPPPPALSTLTATQKTGEPAGWRTEIGGYFRAPISMGISSRPGPDFMTGPASTQVSYGPNRTVDASYFSFAYTRLQEQDWVEVFVHARKPHVDAAVGWMGYWFQAAGFRNPDAAWAPAAAYVALDTTVRLAGLTPAVAFTVGSWWPRFGYFEKYDTYTLGRFRQIGEQLAFTVPVGDLAISFVHGFGTNRDGSFNYLAPPFYGAITGLDLITWANLRLTHGNAVDVGFHYNTEWTADPNLTQQSTPGDKSYAAARNAHLTTVGAEASLNVARLGRLWISPSFIHVRDGWALASAGTEVMHALGGLGIATNYLAWTGSPSDSTGSGSMLNLGFLYANSLSTIRGRARGPVTPDLTLSLFALLTSARLALPAGSAITQDRIRQLKYGADATLQALTWLAFTIRYDLVNYDLDHGGYIFAAVTPRVTFASHFLSGERIYLQYSRYVYGDKMVLNGTWPWGAPLIAGSNVLQQGPYSGQKPDENVVKLQAEIVF
jgi:hypothetical protein